MADKVYCGIEDLAVIYQVAMEQKKSSLTLVWRLGPILFSKLWFSAPLKEEEARRVYETLGYDQRLEFLVEKKEGEQDISNSID